MSARRLLIPLFTAAVLPLYAGAPGLPHDEGAVRHALERLTYGPRPGDVERVQRIGLDRWIDDQLHPSRVDDRGLDARLAGFETLDLDAGDLSRDYIRPAREARQQRQREEAGEAGARDRPAMMDNEALRRGRQPMLELSQAKVIRAVYSERQLEEVLVDFWFNHFNVFAGKGAVEVYVTEYERDVVRPHVFGRFRDLLEATAKSPAMLFYLDNWMSASEDLGKRDRVSFPRRSSRKRDPVSFSQPNRPRGLNENYARELLELHTLGVDGGYTQDDVVQVAKAFTGWTLNRPEDGGFRFVPLMHERGDKRVLGHTIRGGGIDEGLAVLDIVAAHPSTARHIATKLARKFVSDEPPAALVDRAAARFRASGGDLREVVRTIITSPEFFAPEARHAKVKTPLEFVASALRATGASTGNALALVMTLRELGMPAYFCQPPTGYDEIAEPWLASGALVARMNFAVALANNRLPGVRVQSSDPAALAQEIGSPDFQKQ